MRDLSLLPPHQHADALALDKAEQLGLWGPLATHQVRAHVAQGPHGAHVVTAHQSHHHAAAPVPVPLVAPARGVVTYMVPDYVEPERPLPDTWQRRRRKAGDAAEVRAAVKYDANVVRAADLHEQMKASKPLSDEDRDWIEATWATIPNPVSRSLRQLRAPSIDRKLADLMAHLSEVATARAQADVAKVEAVAKAQPAAVTQRWRELDVSRLPPIALGPPPSPNRDPYPYAGSVVYQGLPLLIENAAGSTRSGKGANGTPWSIVMLAHYGEIADTVAVDGDPLDVYLGPVTDARDAYVIHQKIPGTERWDEDKIVLGVRTAEEAEALYRAHYDRPGFFGGLTCWALDELKAAIRSRRHHRKRLDTPSWVREKLEKALDLGATELAKCDGVNPARAQTVVAMLGRVVAGPLVARVLQEQQDLPIGLALERLELVRQLVRAAMALAQARRQLEALAQVQRDLADIGPLSALEKAEQVGLFGPAPASAARARTANARPQNRAAVAPVEEPHQPDLFTRPPSAPAAPAPIPQHPPGAGWMPIVGSARGGQHRRAADGSWEYWYPASDAHPGGVQAEHHPDDVEAVARVEGRKLLLRTPDADGGLTTRIHREYRTYSGDAVGVYLLNTQEMRHLHVGSVFYEPSGEAWRLVEHVEAAGDAPERWTFQSSRGGRRHFSQRWEVSSWMHEVHDQEMRVEQTARREARLRDLRTALQGALTAQAGAAKQPTVETVAAAVNATRAAVKLADGMHVPTETWIELLGLHMKRPRSWEALVHEHQKIAAELRARLPGSQWSELHNTAGQAVSLFAATPELAAKALRMRWLGELAADYGALSSWSEDSAKQPVRINVHSLLDAMQPDKGGRYTIEQVGAALKGIWADHAPRGGTVPRNPASRRVVIDALHKLYDHQMGDDEEGRTRRAKVAALAEYAALSENRTLLLSNVDFSETWRTARAGFWRAEAELDDVIRALGRDVGAEPCPELYGDELPAPLHPALVKADLKLRGQRLDEADPTRGAIGGLAALLDRHHDPIVTVQMPTGEMTRPIPDEPDYVREGRQAQTLPLSAVCSLLNERAQRRAAAQRQAHRERAQRLRKALDKVDRAVGDPARFVEQATVAHLHALGHAPERVKAAMQVMQEKHRDLLPVSWRQRLWGELHPDEFAQLEAVYQTKNWTDADIARGKRLREQREAFAAGVQQAQTTGVLDGLRAAIGHPTDVAAAVAKIRPPPAHRLTPPSPPAGSSNRRPDELTGPAKPYDIEADPLGLRRLLGWCHRDVVPAVDIRVHEGGGRAHCGYDNSIALSEKDVRRQVGVGRVAVHEYGHAIEHGLPEVTELVNTLRDERAKGHKRLKLADIAPDHGYEGHEVAYPDDWASPYTGKWYGHQGSTEVLSMGVEQLMTDPVGFAARDRQHFLITVGALSGLLGTKRKAVHATEKEPAP